MGHSIHVEGLDPEAFGGTVAKGAKSGLSPGLSSSQAWPAYEATWGGVASVTQAATPCCVIQELTALSELSPHLESTQ